MSALWTNDKPNVGVQDVVVVAAALGLLLGCRCDQLHQSIVHVASRLHDVLVRFVVERETRQHSRQDPSRERQHGSSRETNELVNPNKGCVLDDRIYKKNLNVILIEFLGSEIHRGSLV